MITDRITPVALRIAAGASIRPLAQRMSIPLVALALTITHAGFVLLATGQHSVGASYHSLLEWDAQWYASILDNGYQCDLSRLSSQYYLCNCAFFPGLPVLAWPLKMLGLPSWLALPLVAQCCVWGFWTYLLLLMRRWGVRAEHQVVAVTALLLYPWSFFLQVGYSESPFLMFLTGFLYWSDRPGRGSWLLAAVHGAGMTGTRLMGAAALAWPLCRAYNDLPRPWRAPLTWLWKHRRAVLLAAAATLGIVAFYAYLGWRFGRPDLYHVIQRTGMNVRPDYFAFLRWDFYAPKYTNGIVCPLIIVGGAMLAWREWRSPAALIDNRSLTWCLLAVAGLLFYLAMAAMIDRQLCSLPRIGYPSIVLLFLAWTFQSAGQTLRWPASSRKRFVLFALVLTASLLCLALQVYFVQRFIHRRWVV
jgi:hypothetical protein